MKYLRVIILLFKMVSGLEINFTVNRVQNLHRLGNVLGCQIGEQSTEYYIEMPLGARYKEKHVWQKIEERCEKRLAMWKRLLGVGWCLSIVFWILYLHVLCPYFLYQSV